ncbi:MAG TPA: adenylate/guanylate cyclase domain-containing protein [Actinomycetota bacterium]|jgi:class 3 adenylate cyclase
MARLRSTDRAKLPDSAFAYIDSRGKRRLPINDESHVRNALARFERVPFEDDAAREAARKRLLNAARRYGIVPVGFITGQLKAERTRAVPASIAGLPTGNVTFLMTDIEGSTALLGKLGRRYPGLLRDVRSIVRSAVTAAGGREVDTRADEVFAVFVRSTDAVVAAIELQRTFAGRTWPLDVQCRVRVGIHGGRPTFADGAYVGIAVNTAARVCSAGHGGQILVSGPTARMLTAALPAGVRLASLGRHRLSGLPRAVEMFQVNAKGLQPRFPALRTT